jgi:DNA-binding GntR family transcriptional regulator
MHPIRAREGRRNHAITVEEHGRILAALERRDAATARRELVQHLLRGTGMEQRVEPLLAAWAAPKAAARAGARRR